MTIQEKIKTYLGRSDPRDRVGILIVLVVVAGLWAYSRYSKINPESSYEPLTVQTNRENIGSISGGSIGPEKKSPETGSVAGLSTEIGKKTGASITGIKEIWTARQIERNSIKDKTYTVAKGDTLWQIAQGKYGSGFEWTKILEANKDKVGFLPNGSQALIEVGQQLSLP